MIFWENYYLFWCFPNTYHWSHSHFDEDFTIACCLVNECLEASELNDNDWQAYWGLLIQRICHANEKDERIKGLQDN